MKVAKISVALIALLLVGGPSIGAEEDAVRIRVWPHVASEPADVVIQVFLQPNADNRMLRVSAESSFFFRSSERQIEGEGGPRTAEFRFRGLPAGDYDVSVQVLGPSGRQRGVARNSFTIVP